MSPNGPRRVGPTGLQSRWCRPDARGWVLRAVAPIAFLCFLGLSVPWRDAFEFGGDEGMEIIKASMCQKGYALYSEIWNNQPPLYTLILLGLFKVFGPSLEVARAAALLFASLLFAAFQELSIAISGIRASILAVLFLIVSPVFLELCVSVMLEVPAMAVGLASAWVLLLWVRRQLWWLLPISGALMGAALQIKLTAAIIVPAMLLEAALGVLRGTRKSWAFSLSKLLTAWFGTLVLAFLLVGLLTPGETPSVLLSSHINRVAGLAGQQPADFTFHPADLQRHAEVLFGAILALCIQWRLGTWRRLIFPLTLLGSSLIIHLLHRPYWDYYYLHILIPLALLAGHGLSHALEAASLFLCGGRQVSPAVIGLLGVIGTALLLWCGGRRLSGTLDELNDRPRVADSHLLLNILQNREGTSWFYTDQPVLAFLANLRVPPELAIMPLNRFWSGQLSQAQVVTLVERYKPEQIVMSADDAASPLWMPLLTREYFLVTGFKSDALYVSKALRTKPERH